MGIWFRNTNAMSPIITHKDDGSAVMSYITTGGKIHAYFFMQGTAKEIIARYQTIAGKPRLPPYWSMGWHSSSYGYKTFDAVKANVDAYTTAKIPLDGVWFDIPYMENYADFSVDTTGAFKFDKTTAATWQTANKKLIPIIDAGISYTQESIYVSKAQTKKALIIEQGTENTPLQQLVWP
jgi:alpha-glucosidase (family GH31 glycosyl hydrolase)